MKICERFFTLPSFVYVIPSISEHVLLFLVVVQKGIVKYYNIGDKSSYQILCIPLVSYKNVSYCNVWA